MRRLGFDGRPVQSGRGTGIGNYTGLLLRALDRTAAAEFKLVWSPGEPLPRLRNHAEHYLLGRDDQLEQTALPAWLEWTGAEVYHLTQNGLGWPRRLKIPLVVTLHDVIPFRLPEVVRPSYLERFLAEVPGAARAAALIVTVSEHAKSEICAVLDTDPGKVVAIPSAPARVFRPRDRRVAAAILSRRYGLRGPFVLYVGGYNPRKNVAGLIWAYARIARYLPDGHRLVLAGATGPQTEKLRRLAAALEIERAVVFPGFIPRRHLPLFYAAADAFCYPSHYEGFGLPPLEAMACGTPVVASNAASMPEVLGDAAILVPPDDLKAMGDGLLRLLTEPAPAAEYRRRGLARAAMYKWDEIARKVMGVYEQAMGS